VKGLRFKMVAEWNAAEMQMLCLTGSEHIQKEIHQMVAVICPDCRSETRVDHVRE
jgi:Zn finger protein HypA/HybF involved in hydrogenase expression